MHMTSRAGDMVAGILGGSGNHVVQIVIVVVVAVVLITYFLLRLGDRGGGGDIRAVTTAAGNDDRDTDQAHDGPANDATVRLARTSIGAGIGGQSEWDIAIDGTVVGSIANKETVEVSVEPGHHTLRLGSGRHRSVVRSFDAGQDEVVGFRCHGPMIWPMMVAALINPNLWISLRRV